MTARPTGTQLLAELRGAAAAKGVPLMQFIDPLVTSTPDKLVNQLALSRHPRQLTIDRVRACVAGQPVPPAQAARPGFVPGFTGQHRDAKRDRIPRSPRADELEQRKRLAETARGARLPGETLEQAMQRLGRPE